MDKRAFFIKLKEYKYSIFLLILLFFISFIFRVSVKGMDIKSVFWAFVNMFLFIPVLILLAKTFLRIPGIILFSLLITFEIGLFYVYENPLNYGVVASMFATNLSEAYDMIKIALPVVLPALAIFSFIIYKSVEELRTLKIKRLFVLGILLFLILGIVLPVALQEDDGMKIKRLSLNIKNLPFSNLHHLISAKYPFIYGDILICIAFIEQSEMIKRESAQEKTLPDGCVFERNTYFDKIILVIGESSTSQNYSVYGYPIKTTPFLDSLSVNEDICMPFTNVISPAPYTIDALRITLSFSSPVDPSSFYKNKNMLSLAKDAGYTTSWLSNHLKYNVYNSYITTISATADYSYHLSSASGDDLELLSHLQKALFSKEKQFIVLHIYGSHMDYKRRYDERDKVVLDYYGKNTDYDRSIHHTDRVLQGIYEMMKDMEENVCMYYYSDHGEVINKGHAFLNKYKVQYQVPLIVIQNKFVVNFKDIVGKYYNKTSGRFNTSNNIYVLSELLGYNIADSLILKARKDGEYIYQPNGEILLYDNVID